MELIENVITYEEYEIIVPTAEVYTDHMRRHSSTSHFPRYETAWFSLICFCLITIIFAFSLMYSSLKKTESETTNMVIIINY